MKVEKGGKEVATVKAVIVVAMKTLPKVVAGVSLELLWRSLR